MKKLWGGRFRKKTNPLFEDFSRQSSVDETLLVDDLRGSLAHAKMLRRIGLLSKKESARLVSALSRLFQEALDGKIAYDENAEDVHTFVEALLTKRVGEAAKKLHTARSRNDQVSLDTRLYCKREILSTIWYLENFQRSLLRVSKRYRKTLFPGYTHLQQAQPILLAHHLLAYCEMFERDKGRFKETLRRVDVMPLGSGAIAGSSFPIDRAFLARELGFSRISENSIDAVSDRDYVIELLGALSLLAMHLSRLSEELILWSTKEFNLIEIDEAFCTGSSQMPQKKNPDFLELVRGEAGRVYGNLMTVLTVMKGLPLAYNRDMQLDKAPLMGSLTRIHEILILFPLLFEGLKVREEVAETLVQQDGLLATDLAEYLVKKGVPFREAHESVGKLMQFLDEEGRRLASLSLKDFRRFSPQFGQDLFKQLTPEASVSAKISAGGTGPREVNRAIAKWEKRLFR